MKFEVAFLQIHSMNSEHVELNEYQQMQQWLTNFLQSFSLERALLFQLFRIF